MQQAILPEPPAVVLLAALLTAPTLQHGNSHKQLVQLALAAGVMEPVVLLELAMLVVAVVQVREQQVIHTQVLVPEGQQQ